MILDSEGVSPEFCSLGGLLGRDEIGVCHIKDSFQPPASEPSMNLQVLPPDLSHLSPALPSDHRITKLRPQQSATSTCIGLSAPGGSGTTFREHGLRICLILILFFQVPASELPEPVLRKCLPGYLGSALSVAGSFVH